MILIYSSLTRTKSEFRPLTPEKIKIYSCGITPYDHSHMGHGVAAIRFNMIRRYLQHRNYKVEFVQNVTNVDDKLIRRSQDTGRSPVEIGEEFTREYDKALEAELDSHLPIPAIQKL